MYSESLVNSLKAGLQHSLDHWRMPRESDIELLTTSENATFLTKDTRTDRKLVLRVHRPAYHRKQEIESELAWIHALRDSGDVRTPAPVTTREGKHVHSIHSGGREFFVVGFEHVEGHEPEIGQRLPDWFEKLGAVTATLHQHSRQWTRPAWFERKAWNLSSMIAPNGLWGDWRQAPGLSQADQDVIERAIERIRACITDYGQIPDRYGLVHADLRLSNLLVDDNHLAIIDFDDSGFCWYAYDFAAAISFHELDPIIPRLREAWVRGYRSVADFDRHDEAVLDTFIMIRRIMLSAWLAGHSETETCQAFGQDFARGTVELARRYLRQPGI
jgi:Ser/Thr protein kinase RdoA (MazF antagonist)